METIQWFGDNRVKLTVTYDDQSCLAEITVPKTELVEVDVDILYRAWDASGFTVGPTVSVFQKMFQLQVHKMIQLQVPPERTQCFARFWLPRNLAGRFRESFFRISTRSK
jgi:hypothetical protein